MWSDNESNLDLLGCSHLVRAVTTVINNELLLPATIGVFGDWGSGKSSLMKMVEFELSGSHDVLVLSFNGWLFEGYEDAKTALMGTAVALVLLFIAVFSISKMVMHNEPFPATFHW